MTIRSVKSIQGRRDYMEDRYAHIVGKNVLVAMVCDGHGGSNAAEETVKELPYLLVRKLETVRGSNLRHAEAIRDTILGWGECMKLEGSGTTLTGIAVKNGVVYVYNVGDSRTIIKLDPQTFVYSLDPVFGQDGAFIKRASVDVNYTHPGYFVTRDHDSDNHIETVRIQNSGGVIVGDRLNGILSLTRAFGDHDIGRGLSYVPDLYWFNKKDAAGPVLMISDGIYEPEKNAEENVNFSDPYLYNLANVYGSDKLVDYAYHNNSGDNLTALLVDI